jgi:hypothetical protein
VFKDKIIVLIMILYNVTMFFCIITLYMVRGIIVAI